MKKIHEPTYRFYYFLIFNQMFAIYLKGIRSIPTENQWLISKLVSDNIIILGTTRVKFLKAVKNYF